jgi:uncharacterized protein (TIGR00297 family)
VGLIVAFFGSIQWLIVLLVFAISSHFATKAYFDTKKKQHVQEGLAGERRVSNVFYAAVIGIAIASLNLASVFAHPIYFHYFELFSISLAVVSSDTFASEIGQIDKKVYMITNLKRTTPGINGGISLTGEAAALLGAFIVAITYGVLNSSGLNLISILLVGGLGFLGCQIDSILGATLENRNKMSKGQVNFSASLISVLIAIPILFFLL